MVRRATSGACGLRVMCDVGCIGAACAFNVHVLSGPHRLVVRTSRRGRDNPGSTPGVVIF